MRWPWSRKAEPAPGRVGHGVTFLDPNMPFCADHGVHCDGIAVGYAVGGVPSVVITLTLGGAPVGTLIMPNEHADTVAASILRQTSGGMIQ